MLESKMNNWVTTFSSVTGISHIGENISCQDSCFVLENDKWLSMVVSDGAGTAKHSEKGSSLVSKSFAKALLDLSAEIEHRTPGAWINDYVIEHIVGLRNEIRSIAKSDNISDFHCTLVACLISESGGFLIHIGDGALFGGPAERDGNDKVLLSKDLYISLPENGEYSNETFFITEGDWIKHLRITPVSKVDWIIIATDGGTSLSMIDDKQPKPGFVIPLLKTLESERNSSLRQEKLRNILSDEQTNKLTSDDKTICIAFKSNIFENAKDIIMPEVSHQPNKQLTNPSQKILERIQNDSSVNKYIKLRLLILVILAISIGFLGFFGFNYFNKYFSNDFMKKEEVTEPKKEVEETIANSPHQI